MDFFFLFHSVLFGHCCQVGILLVLIFVLWDFVSFCCWFACFERNRIKKEHKVGWWRGEENLGGMEEWKMIKIYCVKKIFFNEFFFLKWRKQNVRLPPWWKAS